MRRQAEANIPTPLGDFNMIAYADHENEPMPHLALVREPIDTDKPVLIRIHSECFTGDVMGSNRCDCGEQLSRSLEMIGKEGGALIYLRQEGRGIGLINKLKAYNLQDQGLNTAEANTHLGFEVDARQYDAAVYILADLNISSVRLLTNNPLKIEALSNSPIKVVDRVPIVIDPKKDNSFYLKTKRDLMGHLLNGIKVL